MYIITNLVILSREQKVNIKNRTQQVSSTDIRKQESVLLVTIQTIALPGTPELVLVPEDCTMACSPTRVVMRDIRRTLKTWDTC